MVSISYSDSNDASDTDDRKSISVIVNTIGGMLTSWTSKKKPSVTLSTTEAEYVAISVCAQESIFQNKLLKELGVYNRSALIKSDKIGAFIHHRQRSGK